MPTEPFQLFYPAIRGPLDGGYSDEEPTGEFVYERRAAHFYRFDELRRAWIYRGAASLEKWRKFCCEARQR